MRQYYPVIDAHHHFWTFDPLRDAWITEDMQILRADYLPVQLEAVYSKKGISGSVLVQTNASESENLVLLEQAEQYPFIRGVVGWIDLKSAQFQKKLEAYQQYPLMKGFRHLLQGEEQRDMMLNPEFRQGIELLNQYGYSFDLLILPDQLGYAEQLVAAFPEQRFVIDHMAKPYIKQGVIAEWKQAIKKFAPYKQVYCKISGLVNEADWEYWEHQDFRPYIDAVVEAFGTKRIMFGSDWPVCLLAATYDQVKDITDDYFYSFTTTEQADFFGNNAKTFYKLV
ncbi:MAG TPA: amidohydrolase family protein [Puia sp.]